MLDDAKKEIQLDSIQFSFKALVSNKKLSACFTVAETHRLNRPRHRQQHRRP